MSQNENIILKVENISKQYRLGTVGTGTLSHDINRWWHAIRGKEDPYLKVGDTNDRTQKANSDYVWALQDISFDVARGEVLGIIGKNGAGKSTLLKILSKVTAPTTGVIKSRGRIASLLEVGTGFNPELTGRENIFLNGAILGMTKKEIASKLDEIIAFSGCERYIDTPTKRYSSGMTVRLAFAVAAFLEPEILVVDEVLAVGDAEFQKKAIGKMQDISKSEGRTVLFVSHNMAAVQGLCTKAVVLHNGKSIFEGGTKEAIDFYLNHEKVQLFTNPAIRESWNPTLGPKIKSIQLTNDANETNSYFKAGEQITVALEIAPDATITNEYAAVCFIMNTLDEQIAVSSSLKMNGVGYTATTQKITCKLDTTALLTGDYYLRFVLHVPGHDNFDDWNQAVNFKIVSHDIHNTGFEYTSVWKTTTFVTTSWS